MEQNEQPKKPKILQTIRNHPAIISIASLALVAGGIFGALRFGLIAPPQIDDEKDMTELVPQHPPTELSDTDRERLEGYKQQYKELPDKEKWEEGIEALRNKIRIREEHGGYYPETIEHDKRSLDLRIRAGEEAREEMLRDNKAIDVLSTKRGISTPGFKTFTNESSLKGLFKIPLAKDPSQKAIFDSTLRFIEETENPPGSKVHGASSGNQKREQER